MARTQLDLGVQSQDSSLTTIKIADSNVTGPKLADNAVGTAKIAYNAVTANQVAYNAITANQLADNAVDTNAILDNAVTAGKLADNAVDTEAILANAVTGPKIAYNAVGTAQIAFNAVGANQLADNAVDTASILANAVDSSKIAFNAVGANQLADNAVDTASILANAVDASKIAFNAVGANQIAYNAVTANQIADSAVDENAIADNVITDGKLVSRYLYANGGRVMTGNLDMNSNYIQNLASPALANDAASRTFVENLVSGLLWLEPADVRNLVGNATVATLDALGAVGGDAYVVTDAGTLTRGSVLVAAGDLVEDDGTNWKKISTNSGGFVPVGTRAILAKVTALIAPYTNSTDDNKVGTFTGASNTATLVSPASGNSILIHDSANNPSIGYYDNSGFVFEGAGPTGSWIQWTGAAGINAGDGLVKNGNTLDIGDAGRGIQVNANNVEFSVSEVAGNGITVGANAWVIAVDAADSSLLVDVNGVSIALNGVDSSRIAYNAVGSNQIAYNAVTANQLADNAVDSAAILDNAVITSKIADSNVTTLKIADSNVTGPKLADNAVGNSKIAYNAVGNNQIAYNAVGADQLADNAVDTAAILANAVDSSKIAFNAVGANQLADNAVDTAAILANAVDASKIAYNAVGSNQIAYNAVTVNQLANNSVIEVKIADSNVTTIKIADNAITSDKIATNAVSETKLSFRFAVREKPIITPNDVRKYFELVNVPVAGSEQLFLNGQLQDKDSVTEADTTKTGDFANASATILDTPDTSGFAVGDVIGIYSNTVALGVIAAIVANTSITLEQPWVGPTVNDATIGKLSINDDYAIRGKSMALKDAPASDDKIRSTYRY